LKKTLFFLLITLFANLFANDISDNESFSAFWKGDMKNAIPYLTKSCRNGEGPLSCTSLAGCYQYGDGVDKDEKKALELYRSACEKNYAPSCFYLASMYVNGEGVSIDYTYAGQLIEKSCARGFPLACQFLEKVKKINQDNAP
jgi:TPR repeat protein